MKNLFFQAHWLLGITAGIILAVVGVTGAMLSFEDELMVLVNPGVISVEASTEDHLSPDELLERVQAEAPERSIQWLGMTGRAERAARVNFEGGGRRGTTEYVHPVSGELLGQPRGEAFFHTVMGLHRWLLAGDMGKQLVGTSTLALIFLALSGLYLRWPRRKGDWRQWLAFSPKQKGRSLLWNMHAAIGTWVLLFYLLASLTGLYWSYEWYRDGLYALSGVEQPTRGRGGSEESADPGPGPLDPAWERFLEQAPVGFSSARIAVPASTDAPVNINYQDQDPAHGRANNELVVDRPQGSVVSHERYSDQPLNERLMSSIEPLHTGHYFGLPGALLMMVASLAMPLFTVTGWMLYLDRRRGRKKIRAARAQVDSGGLAAGGEPLLIGHASQSGTAERLAWQTSAEMEAAGQATEVHPVSQLDADRIAGYRKALFLVATFGDGEPPDAARRFLPWLRAAKIRLDSVSFGVLALGDRSYDHFCAYGHAVEDALRGLGAAPAFGTLEMDHGDDGTQRIWRREVAAFTGTDPVAAESGFRQWRLSDRECLNPGCSASPVYRLGLEPEMEMPDWQAGDVAEIRIPSGAAYQTRSYSVASVPQDGKLELLVRRVVLPDGSIGQGSGWLTESLGEGDTVSLRLQSQSSAHGPDPSTPMILIGSGTGMAGLRAHLSERARAGNGRTWLLFGERHSEHDFYFAQDMACWQNQGVVEEMDLAFSRDEPGSAWVQQRLEEQASRLKSWLAEDAVILVCGSADTMATGVDRVLRRLLGDQTVDDLLADRRYRRDIY